MVRIKYRYLLVNILYPDPSPFILTPITTISPPSPHLPPALLQFHAPTPNHLTPQLLARTIKDQIALLYGDYGVGVTAASLNVKYLSPATSTAIVRCSRTHYRLVWAALSFLTHLPGSPAAHSGPLLPCVFQVLRVSGTIRKSEEEAIRQARAAIMRAKREGGPEGRLGGLRAVLGRADERLGAGAKGGGDEDVVAGIENEDEEESEGEG